MTCFKDYVFRFIEDPGHGWLGVPVPALEEIGRTMSDFTKYSYIERSAYGGYDDVIWLEEDLDAGFFIDMFERKHGHKPTISFGHTGTCRGMEPNRYGKGTFKSIMAEMEAE